MAESAMIRHYPDRKGHPKDKCDVCKRQVDRCICKNCNGHPLGCQCSFCGPILSPWGI